MKLSLFWFLGLFLGITSCTVYKEYPIDVYKPGVIAVPPNVKNIALISRNFKYKNDTLQHYYKDDQTLKRAKGDPKNIDSVLVGYCLNELALNLKTKNNYNQIRIFPDVFKPHTSSKLPSLDFDLINKLTTETETDLVISLETYSYFYSEYSADAGAPKSREVITANVWAVYDPASSKIIERKTMIDTLYWNAYDEQGNYQKNSKLPPRLSALKIASQMAGENYSKRFVASWESVKRVYSVPPLPDFETAEKYLQKGDWDNAIVLWKIYAADKNGKMAINARYNLALAYEMKDDLDTAIQWLTAAQQIAAEYKSKDNLKMIAAYQKVLEQRKKEIERLNSM
jgi:tetratricopeptide (TPR) repeat protein